MAGYERDDFGPMKDRRFSGREKVRILVVEDSATQAESLRYTLEQKGYEVFVAGNGREALKQIGRIMPAAVISDIIMPEMDGFRLCREMKSDADLKSIPLILLTALSDPKDVLRGLECGADNFITKPYDEDYLLSKIRYVLTNAGKQEKSGTRAGVEVLFQGQKYFIASERRQMLDLLLSSYETAVTKNHELKQAQERLEALNEQLERNVERFRLLSGTAGRLLRSPDPQEIVNELCKQVMEHLDCHVFFNFLVNEETGRLRLNACAGIPEEEIRKFEWLDFGVAVCGCVARDAVRIIAEDIFHTTDPRTELVKSYGVQAYCCHPLLAQGKLIGTLSFGTRTRPAFAPDEVALMKSVTDQVAVAMQRLQAERALRESEKKLRSAFANAAIGFAITMPDGRFVDANPAYCALTGYNVEELHTLRLTHLMHPDDLAENMGLLERVLAGEIHDLVLENRYLRKDGETVWVRKSVSVVRKSEGAPHWIVVLDEDITTSKRAEEALKKAHAELQDRARRLEETNQDLEDFAYTISHDLRAPLRAINGFAHMMTDDYGPSLDEEGRRRLGVIETNAVKMGLLIDDLLAFSRAGQIAMNVSLIDMNSLVKDIAETLKTSGAGAKASIRVGALPPAHGDPALIRHVLANLLENAVKFSRKRPEPRVEVGSFERNGEQVYFVKDNGIGFDMKYSDKLFGVFQRLVTEKEFEGTGVGLAIVHRLISRHGGRVWAEAKPGEGATFFFTLSGKEHGQG